MTTADGSHVRVDPEHDGLEGVPRLRAVPRDEVADCKSIRLLRLRRLKGIQDGVFGKSKSGNRWTCFGRFLGFVRLIDKPSPYPLVRSTQISSFDGNAV